MDVVFSVCIVTCGAVGARECFVMHMIYVCILWQFTMLHSAFCILPPSPDSYQVYCDTCDPFSCQAATLGIILKHHMFMSNG